MTQKRASDDWRYLRVAFAVVAVLLLAELAGWIVYRSVHDDPTALELTERCLRREKLLATESIAGDPIATTARGGALVTRVADDGVQVVIASSDEEAARRSRPPIGRTGRRIDLRLDVRGRVVYVWEAVRAPVARRSARRCTTAGTE